MKLTSVMLVAAVAVTSLCLAEGQPAQGVDAQKVLDGLLKTPSGGAKPIQPAAPEADRTDRAATRASVAPRTPTAFLRREGDLVSSRIGRVQRSSDGQTWEFHFESDGKTLEEPPMVLLPNLQLAKIETALHDTNRDLRFRVTGMITEYKSRNYLLIEKASVVGDSARP